MLATSSRQTGRSRTSPFNLSNLGWLFVLILQIALLYLYVQCKRSSYAQYQSPVASLYGKDHLVQQIDAWNKRPGVAGVADMQILLASEINSRAKSVASSCKEQLPIGMKTREEMESEVPELVALVKKHAVDNEIMLGLADAVMICKNVSVCWWEGGNILESFIEIIKRNNITNHLIGTLDDEAAKYCRDRGINYFYPKVKIPAAQSKTRGANRVSTIKYTLVQQLIQLGVHTLVVDMDLVFLDNPFKHLNRDADIEAQTDGFDDMAYGMIDSIHDPTMGWGGGGLYMKTFTVNVGCAYMRATPRTWSLVKRVADRLSHETGWDQQIFNQELLTLSHGRHTSSYATLRIMDYMEFMNSKIFFRSRRNFFFPGKTATGAKPVMVHMNYHPDKHKRMLCIMDRYFHGKIDACDSFPGGSEPNT